MQYLARNPAINADLFFFLNFVQILRKLFKYGLKPHPEFFFIAHDDYFLSLILIKLGYKLLVVPNVFIKHEKGSITGHKSMKRDFHWSKNSLAITLTLWRSLKATILSVMLCWISHIVLCFLTNHNVVGTFKGHLWVLRNLGKLVKLRKVVNNVHSVSDKRLALYLVKVLVLYAKQGRPSYLRLPKSLWSMYTALNISLFRKLIKSY